MLIWPAAAIGAFVLLHGLEQAFPLRRRREPVTPHIARNLVLGALSFGVVALVQVPLLGLLANGESEHGLGILGRFRFSPIVSGIVAFLFLDYTLWIWHWLNHKVPFLWRFHLVHHVDRDLDASTGIRFHFGEMALSIGFRVTQVALLGGNLGLVSAWQALQFVSVLFHHSNLRLPARLDSMLTLVFVTPRMHGIHHSNVRTETDSNWSSLFTVWDRLHGTLVLEVPETRIVIGVPAYSDAREVVLPRLLAIPFRPQRDDWFDAEERPLEI